jgi:hypothetical protein
MYLPHNSQRDYLKYRISRGYQSMLHRSRYPAHNDLGYSHDKSYFRFVYIKNNFFLRY